MVPSSGDIQTQRDLLSIHRFTLMGLLRQHAAHTFGSVPPYIIIEISESRSRIHRVKQILRRWNAKVDDHPDDDDSDLPVLGEAATSRNSESADDFIARLRAELSKDRHLRILKSSSLDTDLLGVRETMLIEAVAVIKADGLNYEQITERHSAYAKLLTEWKPSSLLRYAFKKNGLLLFLYEQGCEAEAVLHILRQKRDTNPVFNAMLSFSWAIDLSTQQLYTHDAIVGTFPPTLAFPGLAFPSKGLLERMLASR